MKIDLGYYWTAEESSNGVYVFGIFMRNTLRIVAGNGNYIRSLW